MTESSKWYESQLRKIELQRQGLLDKYNSTEEGVDLGRVEKKPISEHKCAPKVGQTWQDYANELITHVKYADDKNYQVHIENMGRKSWWTHRSPAGCFMCEDVNLRHVMLTIIQAMALQYPKSVF